MKFRFKIIDSVKENKIIGVFGDCFKVRLRTDLYYNSDGKKTAFIEFIAFELGIEPDLIILISFNNFKNIIELELPDLSYEIIMSLVN
ncbi:MAG: hypothetical protein WCJ19_03000 [bacterium]